MTELAGRRVTVLGLGRHGGGVGAARFLARRGARVTVSDQLAAEELAEPLRALADVKIERFSLGGHRQRDVREAELVVVNPAVRPDHPLVAQAAALGVSLSSEIELFLRACPAPCIGVTGTNGKSTTATLIAEMIRADGRRSWLGGNLGGSLLDFVDEMSADDWVVLELSSFQLARLPGDCPGPSIAVVTNCTPNHLDWHGTWDAYVAAKQRLLRLQPAGGIAIVNLDDSQLAAWRGCAPGAFQCADELSAEPATRDWPLHLRDNAKLAAAAARAGGVPEAAIARGLANFRPLEHRQQVIGAITGRTFVDDSKATTPEATIAALAAHSEPVWLLLGGTDKQCDFAPLATVAARHTKGIACFGMVGARLAAELASRAPGLVVSRHTTLDDALGWCWRQSAAGETILLSPGCASHDQYFDYVARARHFRDLVRDLPSSFAPANSGRLSP
ncbi:MAG: UDP-N-acetylmuramoyl-L-alanine--D-glutamate ligase [Pirellulales bacterium]|nr:UDP-N-acetylmuramoyl-L-alanine--D-glutamate ligase [Pirellulales bacterium]